MPNQYINPSLLRPCGTLAAYRRHLRRGERPCEACSQASRRAQRTSDRMAIAIDRREVRNGLPEFRAYVYQGRGPYLHEEAS